MQVHLLYTVMAVLGAPAPPAAATTYDSCPVCAAYTAGTYSS